VTNQEVINKADLAVASLANNGQLQPAQAQRFLRILIDEAVLMKQATVIPMRAPSQEVDKIRFGSRILRNGTEAVALSEADRALPTLSSVTLAAKLFKAEVRLSNEVLEDSIERGELRQSIMQLMAERIAVDMDDLIANGDTGSAVPFLASFNGLRKSITTAVHDNLDAVTTKATWKSMLKLMPTPFLRNKKQLKILTSNDSEIDYRDTLADRATTLGDTNFVEDRPAYYSGVPVQAVPLFPENIGTSSHCTEAVLMDPKNMYVGIWRDIMVETEKLVREGVLCIVATLRFDFKLAEETAGVKAVNIKVV
jgi:HK97 family phage major capsid protein